MEHVVLTTIFRLMKFASLSANLICHVSCHSSAAACCKRMQNAAGILKAWRCKSLLRSGVGGKRQK
jgi:hypothetical protein